MTLLGVEDDPAHQYVLKDFCSRYEFEVRIVSSAEDALAVLQDAEFAAILMDVGLPGISGIECTKRIRALEAQNGRNRIPIIGLTAQEDLKKVCLDAGMDDFLSKPFQSDNLRKILLRWVYLPGSPNLKLLDKLE